MDCQLWRRDFGKHGRGGGAVNEYQYNLYFRHFTLLSMGININIVLHLKKCGPNVNPALQMVSLALVSRAKSDLQGRGDGWDSTEF